MYSIILLVCILLRAFTTFVSWNVISFCNYILAFVVSGLIVYRVARKRLTLKYVWVVAGLLCTVLFPQAYLDQGKYTMLEQQYVATAERIVQDTSAEEDSFVGEYPFNLKERFLLNNLESNACYVKQGNQYVISFTQSRSFFNWYAFVYVSSPDAVDLILYPAHYQDNLSDSDSFDTFTWIEKNKWALIKWY